MKNINFVAFDFETADRFNACQIGIVVVESGQITEEKAFLIKPPGNKFSENNIKIHGITPDETKDAPTFDLLWNSIKQYFHNQVIVYHGNNNHFDALVLDYELERNALTEPRPIALVNTYDLFDKDKSRSLSNLCKAYNMKMEKHHDALSDARCCALLFLNYLNGIDPNSETLSNINKTPRSETKFTADPNRSIDSDTKKQDLSIVENQDTIFYDKKIVISGVFERYPKRNDLGLLLKKYGADINGSISSKTNIFIVGNDSGPKKMEKVFELNDQGYNIVIIEEKQLYNILDTIKQ